MTTRSNPLLESALALAACGFHVFPLAPGTKRPALHGEARCPRTGICADGHQGWEQRATTAPENIRQAWEQAPYNIGLATGPSRLVVIDLDVPKSPDDTAPLEVAELGITDGRAMLDHLARRHQQQMPETFTVRTWSGGWQLYFTALDGMLLRNTAGRLGWKIDTRAGGGYVVAPDSTVNGRPYTVECGTDPVPLPRWLADLLVEPEPAPRRAWIPAPTTGDRAGAYVVAALVNETSAVASAPEGQRNATLLRAARALGRFVASGQLDRVDVEDALRGAGAAAGLQSRYVDGVVTSALNWSIRNNPGAAA
ncbi:bifunctional DNA primase/polymerase [Kitasatospora sp. P5_F3]